MAHTPRLGTPRFGTPRASASGGNPRVRLALLAATAALAVAAVTLQWRVHPQHPHARRLLAEVASSGWGLSLPGGASPRAHGGKVVAVATAGQCLQQFAAQLEALQQADGAQDYTLLIFLDAPPPLPARHQRKSAAERAAAAAAHAEWERVEARARQLEWLGTRGAAGFASVSLRTAAAHLGPAANKKRAAAGGLAASDFAVVLADGVALAPDGLRWLEWAAAAAAAGAGDGAPRIATASCWSPSFPADAPAPVGGPPPRSASAAGDRLVVTTLGLLDKYLLDSWTQPWGLALWRGAAWEEALQQGWQGDDAGLGQLLQAQGWLQAMPLVPRCNLVLPAAGSGALGGVQPDVALPRRTSVHPLPQPQPAVLQRGLTSAAWPAAALERCAYEQLPRADPTLPLYELELYSSYVRYGIFPDAGLADLSLPELAADLHESLKHGSLRRWRSTC